MRAQRAFGLIVLPALFLGACGGGGADDPMADRFVGPERLVGVVRIAASGSDLSGGQSLDIRLDAGGMLIVASIAPDGTATVPGRIESSAEIEAMQEVLGNGSNDTLAAAMLYGNRLLPIDVGTERAALVRVYPVDPDPSVPDLQGIRLTAMDTVVRSVTRASSSIALDIVVRLYGIDEAEDENSPVVDEEALGLYRVRNVLAPAPAELSPVHFSISADEKNRQVTALGTLPANFAGRSALLRASDANLAWFVDRVRDGSGRSFLFRMFVDSGGGAVSAGGGDSKLIPLVPDVVVDFEDRPITGIRFHAHKIGPGIYNGLDGPVPTYESDGVLIVYGPTVK